MGVTDFYDMKILVFHFHSKCYQLLSKKAYIKIITKLNEMHQYFIRQKRKIKSSFISNNNPRRNK